jgi:hypothetical protein
MAEIYRLFSKDWEHELDFSEQMLLELYYSESFGEMISNQNGYYHGKRMLNLTVTMWKEDIERGLLRKFELYEDFPKEWVDKVLKFSD